MNTFRFEGDDCFIAVNSKTHGFHEFRIDAKNYKHVKGFKWTVFKTRERVYCQASIRRAGSIFLHRLMTSFMYDLVDHIDNDPSNNREDNLRSATHAANMRNTGAQKNNKLGIKGVRWRTRQNRFEASLWSGGKSIYLGMYKTKNEAAAAYNEAAKKYFGEFAHLNEIEL